MKTDQLKQILEIANKNGYSTIYLGHKHTGIEYSEYKGIIKAYYSGSDWETFHINEIIFDPEFGKAFWGNIPYGSIGMPAYKMHQSKLGGMSVEERNDYMVKELERLGKTNDYCQIGNFAIPTKDFWDRLNELYYAHDGSKIKVLPKTVIPRCEHDQMRQKIVILGNCHTEYTCLDCGRVSVQDSSD